MHGNESTTTKALFDLFNFLQAESDQAKAILDACTLCVIPILNPDGARKYTRINANEVDLNRDAQALTQPESKVLRAVFDGFKPDFCYNLHGQRTIFSAGNTNKSAVVSFLSPSQDEACSLTPNRLVAMEIIAEMNSYLQTLIPSQVGIYDDAFNINCVGDTFQSLGVPTILFEAGHYPNDYSRESTRELIFLSYIRSLNYISTNEVLGENGAYSRIPMNEKLFFDIILRNTLHNNEVCDVAVQYQEILEGEKVKFLPKIEKIGDLSSFYGHREVNLNKHQVLTHLGHPVYEGYENDFVSINHENFSLNLMET